MSTYSEKAETYFRERQEDIEEGIELIAVIPLESTLPYAHRDAVKVRIVRAPVDLPFFVKPFYGEAEKQSMDKGA